MPEEIENIEARLCAYIDGELDETARREIERHLQSNPQHRRLMEEMARARKLLQDLPRASAPLEIEEALHSHLERSVLLDDSPAGSAPLRISRWPQIIAAAAIILLAAGLGLIVWLVIRPPAAHQPTAIHLPTPATAPSGARMETHEAPPVDQSDAVAMRTRPDAFKAKTESAASPASKPTTADFQILAAGAPQTPEPSPPAPSGEPFGLVALTRDPLQAELSLRAFLSSQGLHSETISLPSFSLWSVGEPQKIFIARGLDHEQLQALRRLLDVSATTTLEPLAPATTRPVESAIPATQPAAFVQTPASQPSPPSKMDLVLLIQVQPLAPDQVEPELPPTSQPSSLPTTAPAFEDFQMP